MIQKPDCIQPEDAVLIALGSNLGKRETYLEQARQAIAALPGTSIKQCSSILENSALVYEDQPDFLNQILLCQTGLEPFALLGRLQAIEFDLGRQHRFAKGPREIDLDILSHGHLLIQSPELRLPHPGLRDRPYLHSLLDEMGLDYQALLEQCQQVYTGNQAQSPPDT